MKKVREKNYFHACSSRTGFVRQNGVCPKCQNRKLNPGEVFLLCQPIPHSLSTADGQRLFKYINTNKIL